MSSTSSKDDEDDETFLRSIVFPEEDRLQVTTAAWSGGFRWFRAKNVICLEQYRGHVSRMRRTNGGLAID
jgi:hypothetical protein